MKEAVVRLLVPLLTGILPGLESINQPQNRDGGYINTEALEAHIYPEIALYEGPRCRVDRLLGVERHASASRPELLPQIKPASVVFSAPTIDERLAAAMIEAAKHDTLALRRIDAALPYLHNVLRDTGRYEPHAMAMAAACLGRLLDGDGALEFAGRVGFYFGHYGSIRVSDDGQKRFSAVQQYREVQDQWWLMQARAYDLYQHRNNIMHGTRDKKPAWNESEHLLMFRWIVPRLIKLMLSSEGRYILSDIDTTELCMLDRLLNRKDWYRETDDRHAMVANMRGLTWAAVLFLLCDTPTSDLIRDYLRQVPDSDDREGASEDLPGTTGDNS